MIFQSINPYNNEVLQSYEAHSERKLTLILNNAQKEFINWQQTTFDQRAGLMRKCGDILLKNKAEYAMLITLEMGKVIKESMLEVEKCAKCCYFYADNAASFLADELINTDAAKSLIHYQPLGTVLAIMPWNFPFWQVFRFACPTLMAGNVGLLKHAPNVPQCALAIENVFIQAGFPEYCFQNLFVDVSAVKKIIKNDVVKAVTLTGSEKAGSEVGKIAGKYIKKTLLELGGSDAFIVLEDADLEFTAKKAVEARMRNNGQSCISAKRFIIPEKKVHIFAELMKTEMQQLKMGNPIEEGIDYSVLAREDLAEKLLMQVRDSIKKGAKQILGDKKLRKNGAFFEAGILTEVKGKMPAFQEELFGPVASIISAANEEEAIQLANNSNYGLGASIWTPDIEKAEMIARRLEAGAVFVNEIVKSDSRMPFGGTKKSGYGRELSYLGIREFCNIQSIWIK